MMLTDNSLTDSRVFIGGHRKSGTTLIQALLDNHPDLFVYPYETRFWYGIYPIYTQSNYSVEDRIGQITGILFPDLRRIIETWLHLGENQLNFSYEELNDKLSQQFRQSDHSLKSYYNIMTLLVRDLLPCPNRETHKIMVTKNTHSEIHADVILDIYPDAKFIQMVRDPRDNSSVIMNGWEKHYHNNYDSKERLFRDTIDRGWLCTRVGLDNLKKYGEKRYKLVKYEDLVNDAQSVMHDVANFIGISPDLLNMMPTFCGIQWGGNSFTEKTYKGVNSQRIGIYDRYLTEDQIKVIEYYFENEMKELDYNPLNERTDCLEAISDHYAWFNNNQIYSGKAFRKH